MDKKLLITEKPSVAMEFAKALKLKTNRKNGYLESDDWIITWCVGHLVTMSYPEKYDEKLKFWRLDTLPFIPEEWKYEIIPNVANQFNIIKDLMHRDDVKLIYNAGDSGREGEYIQRLVLMMAKPNPNIKIKRVWIDSQTEEEILRGIREAKDISEYDSLSDSAYLRAKEDYLIGINFSRLLSIIFGRRLAQSINEDKASISVGRVMTCVLGMIVEREREIRNFKKTKYYKIIGDFGKENSFFKAEWKVTEKSLFWESNKLYNENDLYLLNVLHLDSAMYKDEYARSQKATNISQILRKTEESMFKNQEYKTITIGDFNLQPYSQGVIGYYGFNATMSKSKAKNISRKVDDEQKYFYFNPMWKLMGDNRLVQGTYYNNSDQQDQSMFWYTFDQLLIRPFLIDKFNWDFFEIIEGTRNYSFIRNGIINKKQYSDHLPLKFEIL